MLSVIIPTHKRAPILDRCLEHLEKQTIKDDIEVIVVNDDGTNETEAVCKKERSIPIRYLAVPPCHQSAARNQGLAIAQGDVCLFIGDDILLAPNACQVHREAHEKLASYKLQVTNSKLKTCNLKPKTTSAVLGFSTWDPALDINKTMRWLEQSGWQFGYPKIAQYAGAAIPSRIQHRFSYTSHISLPTDVAKEHPFRDDVALYGWEDIEWGLRLKKAGISLLYEPTAKAFHHHHITREQSLKRMETIGRSALTIEQLVPELNVVPKGLKRMAYCILSCLPTLAGRHRRAFLRGINEVVLRSIPLHHLRW